MRIPMEIFMEKVVVTRLLISFFPSERIPVHYITSRNEDAFKNTVSITVKQLALAAEQMHCEFKIYTQRWDSV